MNQVAATGKEKKQSWVMRLAAAIGARLWTPMCQFEPDLSPRELSLFWSACHFGSAGMDEMLLASALTRMKQDEEASS